MRSALVAVVLGFSIFGMHPAPAAPFTTAFDELKGELEARRDNDFGGTLDAAKKKQQKAVLKCLALIEKPSSSALDDMKTFPTVARLLEKAYPDEMVPGLGAGLYDIVHFNFLSLNSLFGSDYYNLQSTVGKLVPSPVLKRASKFLKAADAAKNKVGPLDRFSVYGKYYLKAWKSVLKGIPVAQSGELLPAPSMDFTADGLELSTGDVVWFYHSVSQRIDLRVIAMDPATGEDHILYLNLQVPLGDEDVSVSAYYIRTTMANPQPETFDFSGALTSTTLDLAGHRFEGSFDLTGTAAWAFGITGTFLATWHLETIAD